MAESYVSSSRFSKGNFNEQAVSSFSRLMDLVPDSGLGHLCLGTKTLLEGRYKDAIDDLTQGELSQ